MSKQDTPTHILTPPLRWGVLGAARIAGKVVPALKAAGDIVVAIGASSQERAEAFAREHGIPHALTGYQAVLDRDDIDAVYIPLSNALHFRWALDCALAGKHCLCEKPLVLTAEEARQLHEAFKREHLRLLEGFMWRHLPQTEWLRHQVAAGEIGTLRAVGFRRSAVLVAFLLESLLLSLVGGVVGLAAASLMQSVDISTTNFQTFSELAFQFKLTPIIAVQTLAFALAMGFIGGFIPAWRAARMKIVDCLREA